MTAFLKPRKTISLLHEDVPGYPYLDSLSETFDMYRRVSVSFLTDVANYCYLEYLARPIVSSDEVSSFLNKFNKRTSSQFLFLTSARKSESPVHTLEDRIKEQHLDLLPPIGIKCVLYNVGASCFEIEEHTPSCNKYPICYVLSHDQKYFILYTPVMSFLDGYDPYTGDRKQLIIPDTFIQYAKGVLVFQTQESAQGSPRGKKKVQVSTPKFSKTLGLHMFRALGEERKSNGSAERLSYSSYETQNEEILTQNSTESRNSILSQTSKKSGSFTDRAYSRHLSIEPPEQRDSGSLNYSSVGSSQIPRSSNRSSNLSETELESPTQVPRLSSPVNHGRLFQSLESPLKYLKTLPEEVEELLDSDRYPSPNQTIQDEISTEWFYDNMFMVSAAPNGRFYPRSTRYDQPDWRTVITSKQTTRDNCTGCNIF